MEVTSPGQWHPLLSDPTGVRTGKPRSLGQTMVIDKGLGLHALEDLLETAAPYIDMLKIGFGTSPLYTTEFLKQKIEMIKGHDIVVYPGGTFLEVAIRQGAVQPFFEMVRQLGFNGLEVSDGTIEVPRSLRSELICRGLDAGLTVITEYGKKGWGSAIELQELIETVTVDSELGASLVTIEGRESGKGVGIFDEQGGCKDEEIAMVLKGVPSPAVLLWEAPHKEQQVHLLNTLGTGIHLGNIAPGDVISLEALRRGLRSDTLLLGNEGRKSGDPSWAWEI
ncbi:phosphosulfolactate synthase [Paenibacillus mucilaginosus]|uniref:(2R)-phospho-3-sulfolactate synthase, ComA n=3 Tax=Paenibacillus mucilaginosus TaxID=61624 RepID=H6NL68_9BACL|nr:phosphosulfolactate synthase [Paenibacillus mucilaginosus]AEI41222.1 (2R)-phospho-3-sulfolactate synthase, ComA [Paenibacillus mucilaginosus KNP414]AFC29775.1 (2R)-phospho-3-sulfolactate synthase, ComA [Paenibacillus mucilaginosus 3016]AFH61960.1 phospho-3-sulfolactate synthase [Paenibacillus mucilaginosus K02]MCG7211355.1 phosphosulfolactate synthase [Paenibacillus mucilaginosus]WDM30261.1 phosphosulfolactate synthase [Paenibacillus mucilaginosus]